METQRILVTGGAGFIGTNLVNELRSRGHEVLSVDLLHHEDEADLSAYRPGFGYTAPKRELPIVIFATISPLPPLPMPRSAVPAPSSGGSLTPDDRARPLPSFPKSGCAVPSPLDCN